MQRRYVRSPKSSGGDERGTSCLLFSAVVGPTKVRGAGHQTPAFDRPRFGTKPVFSQGSAVESKLSMIGRYSTAPETSQKQPVCHSLAPKETPMATVPKRGGKLGGSFQWLRANLSKAIVQNMIRIRPISFTSPALFYLLPCLPSFGQRASRWLPLRM